MEDAVAPVVTGTPGGSLYDDVSAGTPLSGTEQLTIAGSDSGAGLYRVKVLLDDELVRSEVVHANGGGAPTPCPATPTRTSSSHRQPCPDRRRHYVVRHDGAPRGRHKLKSQLEDAAGNAATVLNRRADRQHPGAVGRRRAGGRRRARAAAAAWRSRPASVETTARPATRRSRASGSAAARTARRASDIPGATGMTSTVGDADSNRTAARRRDRDERRGLDRVRDRADRGRHAEDGTLPPTTTASTTTATAQVDEPGEGPRPPTGPSARRHRRSSVDHVPGADGENGANGANGWHGAAGDR